ncbi:MAG: RnfABCDGE type electron transport complex subunit D [Lachnospiraceae bacterium]|nr:RnfABCDGE type electron transport complex subunit D [Lachnospiraceae bacterium]
MKEMYNVSASPHVRSGVTTAGIMRDVAIALIPASAFGVYQFGFRAFLVLLTSVTAAMLSEYLWNILIKKPAGAYECSALITGLLIGMNLPASVPLWIPIVGSVFAIIVVKEMFGGLGSNFMNPALAARCFLLICFAGRMTDFAVDKATTHFMDGAASVDGISSATPLAVIKNLEAGADLASKVSIKDMFFGFTGGVIGETSVVAILIGAAYLLIRKVISFRIPVAYIASFAVFILLFGGRGFDLTFLACHLCGGGLMLGAWFMATDYVTSPITKTGQIVFGILCGIMTGLIRVASNSAEGVSYSIIFCNLLVPIIERLTMPRAFGIPRKTKKGGAAK